MQRRPSLWAALDALGDLTAVASEWRAGMGDDHAHASPFLVSAGAESPTYPCPSCGAKMLVEEPSRRSRGAFHDDPDCACEPLRDLSPQDLMEWAIHRQTLYDAIAGALGFDAHPYREVLTSIHEIGSVRVDGQRHPVYFSGSGGPHAEATQVLKGITTKPFLLLTAFHDPACEALLAAHKSAYVALADNLTLSSAGRFSVSAAARHIMDSFRTAVAPPPIPTTDTGAVGALLQLAQKLDANPRVKPPNHITVLKKYCLDGHSVRRIAKDSGCTHSTIVNRKKAIERALGGTSLDQFRQYGDAMASMLETIEDKRARSIYRKGVTHGERPHHDSS